MNAHTGEVGCRVALEATQTTATLTNGRKLTYGLGLFMDTYRGLRTVSHGGSWAGYRAELLRFPDQRFSPVCTAAPQTGQLRRMTVRGDTESSGHLGA